MIIGLFSALVLIVGDWFGFFGSGVGVYSYSQLNPKAEQKEEGCDGGGEGLFLSLVLSLLKCQKTYE